MTGGGVACGDVCKCVCGGLLLQPGGALPALRALLRSVDNTAAAAISVCAAVCHQHCCTGAIAAVELAAPATVVSIISVVTTIHGFEGRVVCLFSMIPPDVARCMSIIPTAMADITTTDIIPMMPSVGVAK